MEEFEERALSQFIGLSPLPIDAIQHQLIKLGRLNEQLARHAFSLTNNRIIESFR